MLLPGRNHEIRPVHQMAVLLLPGWDGACTVRECPPGGDTGPTCFINATGCLATVTQRAPSLHPLQGLTGYFWHNRLLHKEWPQESPTATLLSRETLKWSRDPKSSTTLASRGLGYCPLGMPGIRKRR